MGTSEVAGQTDFDFGTQIWVSDRPRLPELGSAERLDAVLAAVESAGGETYLTSESDAGLTVNDRGEPVLLLPRFGGNSLFIVREHEHFLHWSELAARLGEEMAADAAGKLALELMDTPEGSWISEQRIMRAQLAAAIELGLNPSGSASRGGPHAARAVTESNYPALVAIEQTFRFQLVLDQEFHSDATQTELAQAREKLAADLEFFLDETVSNVITEWDRQVRAGQRPAGTRPNSFEDFFGKLGLPGSNPEHQRISAFFRDLTVRYLREAVETYYAGPRSTEDPVPPESTLNALLRIFR